MELIVTYYNYHTDLDKRIFRIIQKVEKKSTFSGKDGGRTLYYEFYSKKVLNSAKKLLKTKLPEDANVKFKVVD